MILTAELQRVPLGMIVSTPAALEALRKSGDDPGRFLTRHRQKDWGVVSADDKKANDDAMENGDRILSAYLLRNNVKIWIITEGDRSVTTILLPEEY